MDRALVSGTRGREFESRIVRHKKIKGLRQKRSPFFCALFLRFQPYFQPPRAFSRETGFLIQSLSSAMRTPNLMPLVPGEARQRRSPKDETVHTVSKNAHKGLTNASFSFGVFAMEIGCLTIS